MREQFEKLPEIARLIREYNAVYVQWRYDCSNSVITGYLNGAWRTYQEQQKKIDSMLDHVCGSFKDFK